jgi:molybdate transport system substrate-binding protein
MISPLLAKIVIVGCLLHLLLATGCTTESETITIFAASSLTDAFSDLATAFETENPDVDVLLNFASSSQLAAQLREGIAGDVFASANPVQMAAVIEAGRIAAGSERVFTTNRLTVIVPFDNPANIATFADLARPNIALILAVAGVPVRAYTDELVARMPDANFAPSFYDNLVSEEDNVRVVVAKIALGEADVAVVYASDVTADIANRVQQIPIPTDQNIIATYPIAPLIDADNLELAQQFIDFVLSPTGQAILLRWGLGQ